MDERRSLQLSLQNGGRRSAVLCSAVRSGAVQQCCGVAPLGFGWLGLIFGWPVGERASDVVGRGCRGPMIGFVAVVGVG